LASFAICVSLTQTVLVQADDCHSAVGVPRATGQLKSYSLIPCRVRTAVYGCDGAKSLGWKLPGRDLKASDQWRQRVVPEGSKESKDEIEFGGKQNRTRKMVEEDPNSSAGGRTRYVHGQPVLAQAPDNRKTNQQVRGCANADQQAENQSDRDLARKIRKSIMATKNLSMYARNVKSITRDGTVMLKGPIRTDDEKSAIESKAVEIAGAANVKSEITVKSKNEN